MKFCCLNSVEKEKTEKLVIAALSDTKSSVLPSDSQAGAQAPETTSTNAVGLRPKVKRPALLDQVSTEIMVKKR